MHCCPIVSCGVAQTLAERMDLFGPVLGKLCRRGHKTTLCCLYLQISCSFSHDRMVEPVQALHARMQPLLLFFIDGANLIDSKEPEWDLLLAVHTKGEAVTVVCSVLSSSISLACVQDMFATPAAFGRWACSLP